MPPSLAGSATGAAGTDATSIVETHILEYHGERRGDLIYTKEMLLAVGDRYEAEIAAARSADAKYR